MYETSPISAITGYITVKEILKADPSILWILISGYKTGLNKEEYDNYFSGGKSGSGIVIDKVYKFDKPVALKSIEIKRVPQNFVYLNKNQMNELVGE